MGEKTCETTKEGFASECGTTQVKDAKRQPFEILTDLSTRFTPVLVEAAQEILQNSARSEYIGLAAALLDDALKYDSIYPHARGYDESISDAVKKLRNRIFVSDSHR